MAEINVCFGNVVVNTVDHSSLSCHVTSDKPVLELSSLRDLKVLTGFLAVSEGITET